MAVAAWLRLRWLVLLDELDSEGEEVVVEDDNDGAVAAVLVVDFVLAPLPGLLLGGAWFDMLRSAPLL
jgi:hypothetical protein